MTEAAKKAFVCGHPIKHSRSPLIHGYWLRHFGIDGSYEAIDMAPSGFADFLIGLGASGFAGGNLTIPHKEAAFAAVSHRDLAAEAIGAVNTVWLDNGELYGGNTDAEGFLANLDDRSRNWDTGKSALVLGAGGAARAVVHALQTRGFTDIRIPNRTEDRALELADHFGRTVSAFSLEAVNELAPDVSLVVNTTALGMAGDMSLPMDVDRLASNSVVTDIVYVPLETPLLAAARARGLKTVDGLGMLLHQAVPGFERWFGVSPSVTPDLRALIEADMAK